MTIDPHTALKLAASYMRDGRIPEGSAAAKINSCVADLRLRDAAPQLLFALTRIIHANDSGDSTSELAEAFAQGRDAVKRATEGE